jgi:transcriptional regulator with XRE-family HTH domain
MPKEEATKFQAGPNGPLTPQAIARLKAIKDSTGMSYAKLGEKVGLSGTFLYNLMNKGMNVGTQHIQRMAEAVVRLEDPATADLETASANDVELLTHTYHLRPSLKVSIDLPTDITAKEAERFSQFIRSLPAE